MINNNTLNNSYNYILKLSIPIMLGELAQSVMIAIDTAFLGRVSDIALGAVAVGGLFYLILVMLGFGFSLGTQIVIARKNGEQNYHAIGDIISHHFYFTVFLAGILFFLLWQISPLFLDYFIKSSDVNQASQEFLYYRKWGIFFALLNTIFRSFYVGILRTNVLISSTIFMSLINVVLDYCLIFGYGGFPKMGIGGAALATVVAELSCTGFFIIYTLRIINFKKYRLFTLGKIRINLLLDLVKISAPMMLQHFLSFTGWFLFFIVIEKLGTEALAVSNIVRSLYMILMIPLIGFSASVSTLVSNFIGANRSAEVWSIALKTIGLSLGCTIIMILAILFIPESFLSLYTSDQLLIERSIPVLTMVYPALIFFSVGMVLLNVVAGIGKTTFLLWLDMAAILVYFSAAYLLAIEYQCSVQEVWIVESLYFFILGLGSFLYLKINPWQNFSLKIEEPA